MCLKAISAVVEVKQPFQDLMTPALQQMQQLAHKVSIVSKTPVANLDALVVGCRVKQFHETIIRHFPTLYQEHPNIKKAVSGILNVQPRAFVTHANAPMTRRDNVRTRFASRDTLYKGVEEVLASRNVDLQCDLQ